MKRRSSRHQDKEEKFFLTVCRDSRLMGVWEDNRSEDPTGQIGNGYTLVLRLFDFIFCSGEKIDKGKKAQKSFLSCSLISF